MAGERTLMTSRIAVFGLLLLTCAASVPASAADRTRVLILAGDAAPGRPETAPVLRRILADSGRFDVRVSEAPAGLTDADFGVDRLNRPRR